MRYRIDPERMTVISTDEPGEEWFAIFSEDHERSNADLMDLIVDSGNIDAETAQDLGRQLAEARPKPEPDEQETTSPSTILEVVLDLSKASCDEFLRYAIYGADENSRRLLARGASSDAASPGIAEMVIVSLETSNMHARSLPLRLAELAADDESRFLLADRAAEIAGHGALRRDDDGNPPSPSTKSSS